MSKKMHNEILLARTIQQNFLWSDKPFSMGQAWIDLLLLAEWGDKDIVSKGEIVHLKRGQVGRSILWLADRWGWSRKRVTHFLKILEMQKMATTDSTTKGTTITIENYNKYQFDGTTEDTTEVTPEEQQKNTSKEIKEIKENNKEKNTSYSKRKTELPLRKQIPPTVEMVKTYCEERHNGIDAEYFCDFYTSKNWMVGKDKMKDWQASVRTWEKNNKTLHPEAVDQAKVEEGRRAQEENEKRLEEEHRKEMENLKKERPDLWEMSDDEVAQIAKKKLGM